METDVELLHKAIEKHLGDPRYWDPPVDLSSSLALCVLNAVYSLSAHSATGANVLKKYREYRRGHGKDPNEDQARELLAVIGDLDGDEGADKAKNFALQVLGNENRLSNGSKKRDRYKSEGVYEALKNFRAIKINSAEDLRDASPEKLTEIERAWRKVKGLGPASWSYLKMNTGLDDIKIDRHIRKFFAEAVGGKAKLTNARIKAAFVEVAKLRDVQLRQLDRAVWVYMEGPIRQKVCFRS